MQSNRIDNTVSYDGFNPGLPTMSMSSDRNSFLLQDLYRLIEAQQAMIVKLNGEV
jgi:hypothetical protein